MRVPVAGVREFFEELPAGLLAGDAETRDCASLVLFSPKGKPETSAGLVERKRHENRFRTWERRALEQVVKQDVRLDAPAVDDLVEFQALQLLDTSARDDRERLVGVRDPPLQIDVKSQDRATGEPQRLLQLFDLGPQCRDRLVFVRGRLLGLAFGRCPRACHGPRASYPASYCFGPASKPTPNALLCQNVPSRPRWE